MTDYEAALTAAREAVWFAAETCIADGHTHMVSHCASESIAAYEALAKAVGATEGHGCIRLKVARCTHQNEADRLAAPYLEVKA